MKSAWRYIFVSACSVFQGRHDGYVDIGAPELVLGEAEVLYGRLFADAIGGSVPGSGDSILNASGSRTPWGRFAPGLPILLLLNRLYANGR